MAVGSETLRGHAVTCLTIAGLGHIGLHHCKCCTGLQSLQGKTLAIFLLRARAFIAVFELVVPSLRSGWVCVVFSVVLNHTRILGSTPTAIVQLQLQLQ